MHAMRAPSAAGRPEDLGPICSRMRGIRKAIMKYVLGESIRFKITDHICIIVYN